MSLILELNQRERVIYIIPGLSEEGEPIAVEEITRIYYRGLRKRGLQQQTPENRNEVPKIELAITSPGYIIRGSLLVPERLGTLEEVIQQINNKTFRLKNGN